MVAVTAGAAHSTNASISCVQDKKNPRVKHRIKYEKALTKERTSLYGKQKRTDNSTAYGGETTGARLPNCLLPCSRCLCI